MEKGGDKNAREAVPVVSAGVIITGDVESQADLHIAGRVEGNIHCATLFIDVSGTVVGSIHADRLRVSGIAEGTINVGDIAIEPGGRVGGEITYSRLKVSPGAVVQGSFSHRFGEPMVAEVTPPTSVAEVEETPLQAYAD